MLGSQTQAVVFKDYDVIKAVILGRSRRNIKACRLSSDKRSIVECNISFVSKYLMAPFTHFNPIRSPKQYMEMTVASCNEGTVRTLSYIYVC